MAVSFPPLCLRPAPAVLPAVLRAHLPGCFPAADPKITFHRSLARWSVPERCLHKGPASGAPGRQTRGLLSGGVGWGWWWGVGGGA